MGGALRILQIGELRLDETLAGDFSNLPTHCQAQVLNAKYLAAEKLFAAAITEQVDLVLLAGSPSTPKGGTRPYWFLQREFEQLAKHGIKVVCAETSDHFYWPVEVDQPENVFVLTRSQSIGFRLAAELEAIEIEWETTEASEAYDSRPGMSLRLIEAGGSVTAISYSASESQKAVVADVHAVQTESVNDSGPFQGTLVELNPVVGVSYTPVQSAAIGWTRIQTQQITEESHSELIERIEEQLLLFSKTPEGKSASKLVTIQLEVDQSIGCALTTETQRSLLAAVQKKLIVHNSTVWPCRIEVTSNRSLQLETTSRTVQVAIEELMSVQLEDVYDNLDLHVLEIESDSFEKSKVTVSCRLPELLTEDHSANRHLVALS